MVFRRNRRRNFAARRIQRVFRRRFRRRSRMPRRRVNPLAPKTFIRRSFATSISLTDEAQSLVPFSYKFRLSDVAGATELTTLFDQYKINWCKIELVWNSDRLPTMKQFGANLPHLTSLYGIAPRMMWKQDFDDDDLPTEDQMLQSSKTKTSRLNPYKVFTMAVKPKVLNEVYRSATTTGYNTVRAPILDCQYADIPHYGIKGIVVKGPTALGTVSARIVYSITMYNTR